eukprot:TRINITY_DN1148_c0_g1_i1.p1 TRINITY_DN1148_c0_g1~~TRINITY_DN1148_c0_g1_i1.p1  ORF type:complete len:603 (+),score=83.16 TRINITY_DN1148_c0_g1_i1:1372-3180(+)
MNTLIILLLMVLGAYALIDSDESLVKINNGFIRGVVNENYRAFKGIRYALPPTGTNRWKPPQSLTKWSDVKNASEYGAACYQLDPRNEQSPWPEKQSEDCLFLNIWTPRIATIDTSLPVLIIFHDGRDNLWGSGSSYVYDSSTFVANNKVIVVTFNYRLGPFGFLGNKLLKYTVDSAYTTTGNFGMMDQQFVLNWVQTNIAAFGGDNNKVTLLGTRSGAESACAHTLMKGSRSLFKNVVLQGSMCDIGTTLYQAHTQSRRLAHAIGCRGDDNSVLKCLRETPAEKIIAACDDRDELLRWTPIADNVFFPIAEPTQLISRLGATPIVIGFTPEQGKREIDFITRKWNIQELSWTDLADVAQEIYDRGNFTSMLKYYSSDNYYTPLDAAQKMASDYMYLEWRYNLDLFASRVPIYLYIFDQIPTWTDDDNPDSLLGFDSQIHFFLGVPKRGRKFDEQENALSLKLQSMLKNFISDGTFDAPIYDHVTRSYLSISDGFRTGSNYISLEAETYDSSNEHILPPNLPRPFTGGINDLLNTDFGVVLGIAGGVLAVLIILTSCLYFVYSKYLKDEYYVENTLQEVDEEEEDDEETESESSENYSNYAL